MAIPEVPTVFAKYANTVTGHMHPIVLPKNSVKPDYEAEFAVVIGKGGRHIPETRWREHVFGYTILNDVSARDFQMQTSQWTMGKTFDTFAPMGPVIVTADEIEDPHKLAISLTLNGEAHAEFQYLQPDFRRAPTDRVPFQRDDAASRRHYFHRHSGGRRLRAQAAPLASARETRSRSKWKASAAW